MTVCFDVDGTLIDIDNDTPRYNVIQLYHLLESFGCDIFIWSGGGVDYATRWAEKLGLDSNKVIPKGSVKPDLAIDDMSMEEVAKEKALGKINLQV